MKQNGELCIQAELEALEIDVLSVKRRLQSAIENDGIIASPAPVSPGTPKAMQGKGRFQSLSNFRLPRPRFQKKRYQAMEEGPLLRRGSSDSDATIEETQLSPSLLLEIVAPLVANLQRVTTKVANLANPNTKEMAKRAEDICHLLSDTLRQVQIQLERRGDEQLDHEMRSLLITALGKKVEAETTTLQKIISPLSLQSENPFIVHATAPSLLLARRESSTPRTIAAAGPGRPAAPFSSFLGTSQQSAGWAMNLIRVGSFQQSMLFSGSPIAVRRASQKAE